MHLYSLIFAYIPLYSLIYAYIPLYSLIYPYIRLYTLIYTYMHLYSLIFAYIPLYTLICPYSGVIVMKRDPEAAPPVRVASMDYFVPEKMPNPSNFLESLVWDREKDINKVRIIWK